MTFGAFHAFHASAILAHHYFTDSTQGRGQALYNSLGLGAAAGSLTSGVLWSSLGAAVTFGLAAIAAALGWLVAWIWVDWERRF